jgi:endonuclease/exonuclease/phosphatase family metal-dependent hydrolase
MAPVIRRPTLGLAASLWILFVGSVEASSECTPRPPAHGVVAASTAQAPTETFTVASLNMAGQARIEGVLAAWMRERFIDILVLQEVGHTSFDGEAFVAGLSERLGFHVVYAPAYVLGETTTQGLAIVSRYPLNDARVIPLTHHRLRFRTRCRIALSATVVTADGPLRLVNVHLDTRINSQDRVAQLAPVLDALSAVDGPQIIGGDFNTMNIGWFRTMWPFPFLQRQVAAVRTLLGSAGFETPFVGSQATFRFLGIPFRLDWLYVKQVEARESGVDRVRFTDHRGVWTTIAPLSRP